MNLSVHDVVGNFFHHNPEPKLSLNFEQAKKLTKFIPKHQEKTVRFARRRAKSSPKLKQLHNSLSEGLDEFAEELAKARKTSTKEARDLLIHKNVKRHGFFNAIP